MLTGPLCRAARALVEWRREYLAARSGVDVDVIAEFEHGGSDPGDDVRQKLRHALEFAGAVFLPEDDEGVGVRLKFTRKDVRAIRRLEGEGGVVGEDDV